MGFDDGRIVLNSDTGIYFAGQTVFGTLIFDQQKEKTFRGIYVKLKGFCKVHWRESHTRRVNGRNETYYVDHNSHEEYFNQKTYLIGSENGEEKIKPGHYEYQFQCVIPPTCPSSFEGTHGHIRYELKAVVDRAFKMDQEKKVAIRVIAPVDLNMMPNVKDPVQFEFDKTYYCCCTSSGNVQAVVKLPFGGYCPGQPIPIEVSCNNSSSVNIDSITFTLKKEIKFHAQGTKHESENVAQLELGEVSCNTNRSFATELIVPHVDSPNVSNCRYIDIDYHIKVRLSPDGCHGDSTRTRNIVIGTIPLLESNFTAITQDQMPQQNVPVINQPSSAYPGVNAYPGNTSSPYPAAPYPGANSPYPGSAPYPGPAGSPYPGNNTFPPPYSEPVPTSTPYPMSPSVTPYPTSNSPYPTKPPNTETITPYPTSNAPYPATNSPYPVTNSPYPVTNSPYPVTNTPYPVSNSNDPSANTPYPASPSPYPPAPVIGNSPYPNPNTGLRTGSLGFMAQAGDNKNTMPQLPPGAAVPYPSGPASNPYAAASAPEPATPDGDSKKPHLEIVI